jgi:hypothetical protein
MTTVDSPSGAPSTVDGDLPAARRRRGAIVAVVAAVVILLGAAAFLFGRQARPTSVVSSIRYTTTITVDGGGLVLAPPPAAAPAFSEADAIALFRSRSWPTTEVSDVWVGYATATVRADIGSGDGSPVPRFDHTAAWVIVDRPGPFMCPMMTGPPATPPSGPLAGEEVYLLDAATGTLGAAYQPKGFGCDLTGGPHVHPAQSYLSMPWTLVSVHDIEATVLVRVGGCTPLSGAGSSGMNRRDLAVFVVRTLTPTPTPCPAPVLQPVQIPYDPLQRTPVHAPAGLVVGVDTTDGGFTYQEGAPR